MFLVKVAKNLAFASPQFGFWALSLALIILSYFRPWAGTAGIYIAAGHGLICYWGISDKEVARK